MRHNIGFDLDGVMCDIYPQSFQVLREMYPDKVKSKNSDSIHSLWEQEFELTQKQIMDCFIEVGKRGIFRDAPVYEGVKKTLHRIKKYYNIYVVTWRNYIPNSVSDTLYWLDSNKLPYHRMIMSKAKLEIAKKEEFCFYIDDTPDMCNKVCKSNTPTYLFRRPWNKDCEIDALVKVVDSWHEIGKILLPY